MVGSRVGINISFSIDAPYYIYIYKYPLTQLFNILDHSRIPLLTRILLFNSVVFSILLGQRIHTQENTIWRIVFRNNISIMLADTSILTLIFRHYIAFINLKKKRKLQHCINVMTLINKKKKIPHECSEIKTCIFYHLKKQLYQLKSE